MPHAACCCVALVALAAVAALTVLTAATPLGIMAFNDMWLTIWIQKAAEYGPSDRDELPMSENLFYGGIFIGGSVVSI